MGEKVLMKGNEAIGEAAIRSGCRHFFRLSDNTAEELSAYMAKKNAENKRSISSSGK